MSRPPIEDRRVFQPVYGIFRMNQKDNASILVVDDDMFVRESTASFLKECGYAQSHVRVPGCPVCIKNNRH